MNWYTVTAKATGKGLFATTEFYVEADGIAAAVERLHKARWIDIEGITSVHKMVPIEATRCSHTISAACSEQDRGEES